VQREGVNHRAEAKPARSLRNSREKYAGRRRQTDWGRVVLGDMIGVKARAFVGLYKLQTRFIIFVQRKIVSVQVIENTKLHLGGYIVK